MGSGSRHISIAVSRPMSQVYAFAADPLNLPQWAAGLAGSTVERAGHRWVTDSPTGRVTFVFAPRNGFGVLDHDVTLPSGEVVHNPLRVLGDGDTCEVVFTLRRRPGMTDEEFAADADAVGRDLATLKALVEAGATGAGAPVREMRLELVPLPSADVERSKAFYVDRAGFVLDHDVEPGNGMRVVQLTPPGSACSVVVGVDLGEPGAGPVTSLHLVVDDVEAARAELTARGVDVSGVDDLGGVRYAYFSDPDGTSWALQETPGTRRP